MDTLARKTVSAVKFVSQISPSVPHATPTAPSTRLFSLCDADSRNVIRFRRIFFALKQSTSLTFDRAWKKFRHSFEIQVNLPSDLFFTLYFHWFQIRSFSFRFVFQLKPVNVAWKSRDIIRPLIFIYERVIEKVVVLPLRWNWFRLFYSFRPCTWCRGGEASCYLILLGAVGMWVWWRCVPLTRKIWASGCLFLRLFHAEPLPPPPSLMR